MTVMEAPRVTEVVEKPKPKVVVEEEEPKVEINSCSEADLRKVADIAPNTMTKLRKDEYVAMPILDKICKTLGTDYGDIMEYVPDKD